MLAIHILIQLIILFVFVGCGTTTPINHINTAPEWYFALQSKPGRIIGYGKGRTRQEAENIALDDIAKQLEVEVHSESRKLTEDDQVSATVQRSQYIRVKSNIRFKRAPKTIHRDFNGSVYYIAKEFDRRPLSAIIKEQFDKHPLLSALKMSWYAAPSLKYGPVLKDIQAIKAAYGQDVTPNKVKLSRLNKQWLLSIGDFIYPVEESEILDLFNWHYVNPNTIALTIVDAKGLQSNVLKIGQRFQLLIKSAKFSGYLTVLNIYKGGRVGVIAENLKFKNQYVFPSDFNQMELEATTTEKQVTEKEVYLAILSRNEVDVSEFLHQSDVMLIEEQAFKVDSLMDWVSSNNIIAAGAGILEIIP